MHLRFTLFVFMITAVWSTGQLAAQTFVGNFTATTQEELNNFRDPQTGRRYTSITGSLTVRQSNSGTPITQLGNLQEITSVGGVLSLDFLREVSGTLTLNNLQEVRGLVLASCDRLTQFNAPNLVKIGVNGLYVFGNRALSEFNLRGIERVDANVVFNHDGVNLLIVRMNETIDGLVIDGSLDIQVDTSPQIVFSVFLIGATEITGDVRVGRPGGSSDSGASLNLFRCARIGGEFRAHDILANLTLYAIDGVRVEGSVWIQGNDNLFSSPFFGKLFCGGNLVVVDNEGINFQELNIPVTFVRWNLDLRSNPRWPVPVTLDELEYVGVSIKIDGMASGELNFPKLNNLRREDLSIRRCRQLTRISAGPDFTTIPGSLLIEGNGSQVSELELDFPGLTEIGNRATLSNNPTLAECCFFKCRVSVNDQPFGLANPAVTVVGNDGDCTNLATIQSACTEGPDASFTSSIGDWFGSRALLAIADDLNFNATYEWTIAGEIQPSTGPGVFAIVPAGLELDVCVTVTDGCGSTQSCQSISSLTGTDCETYAVSADSKDFSIEGLPKNIPVTELELVTIQPSKLIASTFQESAATPNQFPIGSTETVTLSSLKLCSVDVSKEIPGDIPFGKRAPTSNSEGIDAIQPEFEVIAYPNPFLHEIKVNYAADQSVTIQLFNAAGQSVRLLTPTSSEGAGTSVRFNTADLPAGLYILTVTSEDGRLLENRELVKR